MTLEASRRIAQMLLPLAMTLVLAIGAQSGADVRARAEQLARAGRTVEALDLFKQVVAQNPGDVEARLWIARLDLRLGRINEAETGLRAVLQEHPDDIDAKIVLGNTLLRKGEPDKALAILVDAERENGDRENSDLFAALGRTYRRTADDRRALEYFTRAKKAAPSDPDIASGYESVVGIYGHSIIFEGFGQHDGANLTTQSGLLLGLARVHPRVHLTGRVRLEKEYGTTDALGGGGFIWRAGRTVTIAGRAAGGAGNTVLPTSDLVGDVVKYTGSFEMGAGLRRISFSTTDVVVVSPTFAWDIGRWRFDSRYSFSRSHFHGASESTGDHSLGLRETWRRWRRAAVNAAFSYGIESFEDLTSNRVGSHGALTLAAGARFNLPSVTIISATWEHQWRSSVSAFDRLTVAFVQSFP